MTPTPALRSEARARVQNDPSTQILRARIEETKLPAVDPAAARDRRLAAIQDEIGASGVAEHGRGVEEHAGSNRGDRIDEYHENAGRRPEGQDKWCGHFVRWNLDHGAEAAGYRYVGGSVNSDRKARNTFLYRHDETGLRARHEAEGSTRRFMTLGRRDARDAGPADPSQPRRGSEGEEIYSDPRYLPIRRGDVAVFEGHVAQVESYDPKTGTLVTMEGNIRDDDSGRIHATGAVGRRTRNLYSDPLEYDSILIGFGRPALGDFEPLEPRP